MKLGYLPAAGLETEALRSEAELQQGIRDFQAMAHLPQTGRLDAETVDKMLAPRSVCSHFQNKIVRQISALTAELMHCPAPNF